MHMSKRHKEDDARIRTYRKNKRQSSGGGDTIWADHFQTKSGKWFKDSTRIPLQLAKEEGKVERLKFSVVFGESYTTIQDIVFWVPAKRVSFSIKNKKAFQ